jgi:cytochrome c553
VSLLPFPCPPGFGSGPVTSVLSVLAADGSSSVTQQFNGVLPVDVAISPDGSTIASVAAGSGSGAASVENLYLFGQGSTGTTSQLTIAGQTTALAFEPNGDLLVQTREPAALWVVAGVGSSEGSLISVDSGAASIPLSLLSRRETGHDIFHTHAGALIACASCHPEGGDDGHVWLLDGDERRTPSLRGTIEGTAPYHWPGDEHDFAAIVHDVYEVRMSGGALTSPQTAALSAWVNAIPAPPAPTWVDANAAAAGRVIFQRADIGCSTCHSGPKFTNNQTVNVGTGGAFQVPPLVGVGWRTPLLHNGCAATIADRFGACGTAEHGNIQSLTPTDMTNLTAYLETL